MLFKSGLVTVASGKIGGMVASRNKGGMYLRALAIPTNPNTPQQQAVRGIVSQLSSQWESALLQAQRDKWALYAANVTVENRLGDQVFISPMAHFVRSNVVRVQIGEAAQFEAPLEFNLGYYTVPSLANFSEATQSGDFVFSTGLLTDEWANEVGGFLVVYMSRPQNSGIQYFKGPYRLVGPVTGDPLPPATPAVIAAPFAFIAGNRLFGRAVAMNADGRVAAQSFFTTLAVA